MNRNEKKRIFEEFDIEIGGSSIRIARSENENEDRPSIIFLHDSLGCISLWRDFPFLLAEASQCNPIVYDRIGYGKSGPFTTKKRDNSYLENEADILYQLIQTLNLKKTILFGHSDGGSIALIAAAKYPQSISGVITEGAHVFVEEITLDGIREAVESYRTTKLKQALEKYHSDKTDDVFKAWSETWLSNTFRNWNIEHFLPAIQCPVFVIQGENDEYGTVNQVDSIVNQVSGKSFKRMIPNVKHTPHKEAPNLILEETNEFIKNLSFESM
ncbi:alpha/beta hydrolase [Leptospira barantonii]|uniref:Alpha/beta hydrolase n=1 Tax=Leptospira barantonii TaxID=2023184 RepID=A0A5F2B5X7_9LEPT|nr:alpha/beta hydrolase [Leptospira barantonii]TGM01094.1 alpha/beta hydrolase [Leptospira barantonii]